MTGIPKPPEEIPGEGQNNTTTGWDALREDPAGIEEEVQEAPETPVGTDSSAEVTPEPSEPEMYSGPLEQAPVFDLGHDSAPSGLFFSDVVAIAEKSIGQKSETSEGDPATLVIFGDVCVPVYKNSTPEELKKLEVAWARAMRGHCDQQIRIFDQNDTDEYVRGFRPFDVYPLAVSLDNVSEELLATEAQEDEDQRNAGNRSIRDADAIINRKEKYEKLKKELWDVKVIFNDMEGTGVELPPNFFGDRDNPRLAPQCETVFEAEGVMYVSWAIIWAKLMQQRLDSDEAATIKRVAGETLEELGIKVNTSDPLFNAVTRYLLPGTEQNWEHSQELLEWYNEVRERQSGYRSPLPPQAQ